MFKNSLGALPHLLLLAGASKLLHRPMPVLSSSSDMGIVRSPILSTRITASRPESTTTRVHPPPSSSSTAMPRGSSKAGPTPLPMSMPSAGSRYDHGYDRAFARYGIHLYHRIRIYHQMPTVVWVFWVTVYRNATLYRNATKIFKVCRPAHFWLSDMIVRLPFSRSTRTTAFRPESTTTKLSRHRLPQCHEEFQSAHAAVIRIIPWI